MVWLKTERIKISHETFPPRYSKITRKLCPSCPPPPQNKVKNAHTVVFLSWHNFWTHGSPHIPPKTDQPPGEVGGGFWFFKHSLLRLECQPTYCLCRDARLSDHPAAPPPPPPPPPPPARPPPPTPPSLPAWGAAKNYRTGMWQPRNFLTLKDPALSWSAGHGVFAKSGTAIYAYRLTNVRVGSGMFYSEIELVLPCYVR